MGTKVKIAFDLLVPISCVHCYSCMDKPFFWQTFQNIDVCCVNGLFICNFSSNIFVIY